MDTDAIRVADRRMRLSDDEGASISAQQRMAVRYSALLLHHRGGRVSVHVRTPKRELRSRVHLRASAAGVTDEPADEKRQDLVLPESARVARMADASAVSAADESGC